MLRMTRPGWWLAAVCAIAGCSEGEPPPSPQDAGADRVAPPGPVDGGTAGDAGPAGDGGVIVADGGGGPSDGGVVRACGDDQDCNDQEGCTIDRCNARGVCEYMRDTSCNSVRTGGAGRPFSEEGQSGVAFDEPSGGLIVRAESRRADYLWIPNVNESTLSKWDANTATEIGRYRVGLPSGECRGRCCWENGCNMPSRTVVDGVGDAYVANRAFGMQGTVTKIAADRRDCVDRNMNGMIDTSMGPMDVRPFGEDECVLWTAPAGPVNAVLRSLTIDRGDETFPQGYPWVGSCGVGGTSGNAGLFQLNPRTGAMIRSVAFGACAYGAVVTPDGTMWQHSPSERITPVNTTTGMVLPPVPVPAGLRGGCTSTYGITADARGRIWLSGRGCRDVVGYDPMTRQWTRMDLSGHIPAGGGAGLGITVDPMNRVWVPISLSGDWEGQMRLARFSADDFMGGSTIPSALASSFTPPNPHTRPTAVGADRAGNIWVASASSPSPLTRFEPEMNRWQNFSGTNMVYTYTDFTGAVRRLVIGRGTYSEDYETCEGGTYGELYWDSETPAGTTLTFSIQLANTRTGLAMAPAIPLGVAPRDGSPINIANKLREAGVTNLGRFARITVTFVPVSSPMVATPVLRSLSFTWRCGGVG
jgi:streptogramin lyase